MKFGLPQLLKLNATNGAYSPVTQTEYGDGQITATGPERELLEKRYARLGQTIYRGSVKEHRSEALKEFHLFPTGKIIQLPLNYPKSHGRELRLYLDADCFKPDPGQIWFLYETVTDELWIGALDEASWRKLFAPKEEGEDGEEVAAAPEDAAVPEPPATTTTKSTIPIQDPALVQKRMQLSKFSCEYDSTHKLFVARATGCRYVEVHHLIPKKYQAEFWTKRHKNLMTLDNLCSLCPWCHRAIHHAEESLAREILDSLYDTRSVKVHYGITKRELHQLYSVEEIIKGG